MSKLRKWLIQKLGGTVGHNSIEYELPSIYRTSLAPYEITCSQMIHNISPAEISEIDIERIKSWLGKEIVNKLFDDDIISWNIRSEPLINCIVLEGKIKWEKHNVNHDHSHPNGTGLLLMDVGIAIIKIIAINVVC